uniref:Uncharacterized protein n=1 Tax=Arundo donax TaxID=35708 RepID=A0A0A9FFH7_ARUDO
MWRRRGLCPRRS